MTWGAWRELGVAAGAAGGNLGGGPGGCGAGWLGCGWSAVLLGEEYPWAHGWPMEISTFGAAGWERAAAAQKLFFKESR